jgi:hypothetical protein
MLTDARGCPTSAPSSVSLQQYEQALELSASYQLDPLATIQKAIDADPTFAMGHALRAGLAVMASDRGAVPLLTESVEAIEALGRRTVERERAHAAAARAWLEGDFAGSVHRYGEILLDYPHDLLALQVAHVGDFFLGAASMLRDRVAQVLPMWDTTTPGYGYVLGMYAFGLEENALYSRAEDIGRRALDVNRRDAWAVHAVTHVMEMQGRLRDGVEWLTARESDWSVNNGFAFHNWWHLALFHLDAFGDPAGDDRRDCIALALGAALGKRRRPLAEVGGVLGTARGAFVLRVQRRACGDGIRCRRPERSRAADDRRDGAHSR